MPSVIAAGLLALLLGGQAWAMSEVDRITIAQDGKATPLSHSPMVVDTVHHVAYLGTDDAVVKLDLATFRRIGSIPVDPAIAPVGIGSAAIDAAHGYAYFGTFGNGTVPGRVLRLDLATFTFSGTPLALPSTEPHSCTVALVDPAHGFGYFGTGTSLRQVDLATFTFGGSFAPTERVACAAIDAVHGFLYTGGSATGHGVIIKVALPTNATFTRLATLTLGATSAPLSIETDPAASSAYLLDGTLHGATRVNLATFTQAATLALPSGFLAYSAGFDALQKKLYVGGYANSPTGVATAEVLKLDATSSLTLQGTATRSIDNGRFYHTAVDAASGKAYFASSNNPCQVHQLDLPSFAFAAPVILSMRVQGLATAMVDSAGGHAYFFAARNLSSEIPCTLVKVALPSLAIEQELVFTLADDPRAPVVDLAAGFMYLGTFAATSEIIRVRLSDLTLVDRIPLASGEGYLSGSAIDATHQIAYFVDPLDRKIVRVGTAATGFARIGAFQLGATLSPRQIVVDPTAQMGYVIHTNSGSSIVKIDLNTGAQIGSPLGVFQNLREGALDPVGGSVLFVGSQIVKVQLASFTATTATVRPAEDLYGIAIDAAHGLAYAASELPSSTDPWLGQISLIRLSDLARPEYLTLSTSPGGVVSGVDPTAIRAIAIDPAHSLGYLGTPSPPSQVVEFSLNAGASTTGGGTTSTGTTASGTASGGTTVSGTTSGASTSGASTSGATTSGATTSGSATNGATTSGSVTGGSTSGGGTTSGGSGGSTTSASAGNGSSGGAITGSGTSSGGGCGLGSSLGLVALAFALQLRRGRERRLTRG